MSRPTFITTYLDATACCFASSALGRTYHRMF